MLSSNGRLKLAIQRDGRMTDDSLDLLKSMGLVLEFRTRSLLAPCQNFPLDILFVRDDDIPEYVQDGVSDMGIVGENIVVEKQARLKTVRRLGFGKCRLVICTPKEGKLKRISQLHGKRIATSYPQTLEKFLSSKRIPANIIEI